MGGKREPRTLEDTVGRCWACGYLLRGLPTNTCPECGRAFDPADRTSMNLGRAMGRTGRFLCRRPGWWPILLALAVTAVIALCSRWPVDGIEWSLDDLRFYWREMIPRCHWPVKLDGLTLIDRAYMVALAAWALVGIFWLLRLIARFIALRAYTQPRDLRPSACRRHAAVAVMALTSAAMVGASWPWRQAQHADGHFFRPVRVTGSSTPLGPPPRLEPHERKVLLSALVQLGDPRQRFRALTFAAEGDPDEELYLLLQAAPREKDATLRSNELHLIGMYRDLSTASLLLADLKHPDDTVRAAAADALGMLHCPAYDIPRTDEWTSATSVARFGTVPPMQYIGLNWRSGTTMLWSTKAGPPRAAPFWPSTIPLPPRIRVALEDMMLRGPTALEREAAARALVTWPPTAYELRIAEWGVWIGDASGNLTLAQSLVDEIPPFVHRIGNTRRSFDDRLPMTLQIIHKPVIHVTADHPMAVDLEAQIEQGRVWFAYPCPDDLSVRVGQRVLPAVHLGPDTLLERFDNGKLPAMEGLHEGYPWISPPDHRLYPWISPPYPNQPVGIGTGTNVFDDIIGLGVRWQSLIVSPEKLSWMAPATVGADPKFAWWSRLREAPCSWVCSRGESERFLYYDGPTLLKAPLALTSHDHELTWRPAEGPEAQLKPPFPAGALRQESGPAAPREGVYIEVAAGQVRGRSLRLGEPEGHVGVQQFEFEGDAVPAHLLALLSARGLTEAEASALIDCWRPQFLQTAGRRVLMLLKPDEYDRICPLYIRSAPTKLVRVGIVLTEL